jgi:hypothetical protein
MNSERLAIERIFSASSESTLKVMISALLPRFFTIPPPTLENRLPDYVILCITCGRNPVSGLAHAWTGLKDGIEAGATF